MDLRILTAFPNRLLGMVSGWSQGSSLGCTWVARMRPNRSSLQLIALFRESWPGGCLPRALIYRELERHGTPLPIRTVDYALAQAVRHGELAKITSYDAGAMYCLASLPEHIPVSFPA